MHVLMQVLKQVYQKTLGWFTYIKSGKKCCYISSIKLIYSSGPQPVYSENLNGRVTVHNPYK